MNIFFLDKSPKLAAQYHCDKHVVKMTIETAQVLSAVHHLYPNPSAGNDPSYLTELYKPSYQFHPITAWVARDMANYVWTTRLLGYLLDEYTLRWNKQHATSRILPLVKCNLPNIPIGGFSLNITTPYLAMPEELKQQVFPDWDMFTNSTQIDCLDRAVAAYRRYYIEHKGGIAKWAHARSCPNWWPDPKRAII